MRESKAELMDRLRREGRWEAFKNRREQLKAGGTPPKQAWIDAGTEFPPIDPPTPAPTSALGGNGFTASDLEELQRRPAVSLVNAVQWALEHLDADWVRPIDAPSLGAWSLRTWARTSPSARATFYRTFAAKIWQKQLNEDQKMEEAWKRSQAWHQRAFGRPAPEPEYDEEDDDDNEEGGGMDELMNRLKGGTQQ